jgi:hypothetical protein
VVLAAELDPQRHPEACDVSPAVDGVAARQRNQGSDRIGLPVDQRTYLALPVLVDPPEHGERQVLLVLELVIQGAARVARIPRNLFEREIAVAVTGKVPRGGLEQCAARTGAALGVGCATLGPGTYMHVCM